jgi:hypothetical protein
MEVREVPDEESPAESGRRVTQSFSGTTPTSGKG